MSKGDESADRVAISGAGGGLTGFGNVVIPRLHQREVEFIEGLYSGVLEEAGCVLEIPFDGSGCSALESEVIFEESQDGCEVLGVLGCHVCFCPRAR